MALLLLSLIPGTDIGVRPDCWASAEFYSVPSHPLQGVEQYTTNKRSLRYLLVEVMGVGSGRRGSYALIVLFFGLFSVAPPPSPGKFSADALG